MVQWFDDFESFMNPTLQFVQIITRTYSLPFLSFYEEANNWLLLFLGSSQPVNFSVLDGYSILKTSLKTSLKSL